MCDALIWSFDAIAGLPWLEVIKALAPVVTALIAWRALQNWSRQDKAKRQADFLDQLLEAVHDFMGKMPAPVTVVDLIKIGMASHIPMQGKNSDPLVAGAIEYVERQGDTDAKRLIETLEAVRPVVTRLRALRAKGNVFKFQNYAGCANAVGLLVWQFDRMQGLASFMRNPHWYWENEEVIAQLKKLMAIEPEDIRTQLNTHHGAIISCVGETYGQVYR